MNGSTHATHHAGHRSPADASTPATPHAGHRSLQDDVRHRGIEIPDSPYRTTLQLRHSITRALDEYRDLSAALVEDNSAKADRAAVAMQEALRQVSTDSMRSDGARVWRQHAELYEKVLRQFQHEDSIALKRSYFAHLSEIVYCTVKSFSLGAKLSNVFFCPMALEGKGAFWLNESKQVQNPYMGVAMPACGEMRETLGP